MNHIIQASYQDRSFDVAADIRIQDSELIVFLHGLGCSRGTFSKVFSEPIFANYSIVAIDMLGFGDSSKPEKWPYFLEDHATIVSQIISQIPSTQINVVGHSFGGAVGLLLDSFIQNKLKSFISCEGNLISEDCGFASRRTISTSLTEFKERTLPEFEATFPTGPGFFEFDRMSPTAFYRSAESLVQWSDSGELLKNFLKFQCKKGYVFGNENCKSPILSKLPDIIKREIPSSGHFMFADNPTQTYQAIFEIIRDV